MIKLLAPAVAGSVLAILAIFSPIFEIQEINIKDNNNCLALEAQQVIDRLQSKNLIFLNAQEQSKHIQSQFGCAEQVLISKQYPSQIEIGIQAKIGVAKLGDSDTELTSDGLLIKGSTQSQVPRIYLRNNIKPEIGQKIEEEVNLTALLITAALLKSDFIPLTVRIIDNNGIAVYSNNNILAMFSSVKDPSKQVDTLQRILAEAKIDATKIEKIDLRFEKPIITPKK